MTDSGDMYGDTPAEGTQDSPPSAADLEAAGQSAMFGDPAPAAPPPPSAKPVDSAAQPYRVLARKYRPQTFSELIGQEPMVRTLANAIKRDRLAHAFLMTGVRGVGKTSTARLIAKALNCIGPDGQGGPTIDPCGQCEPCTAIAEGRHIDVIEMDAASNTGVDDVREIIEAVRYAAVSARYKIYIIDEVHMLSRNAFNALLKTLEEPPSHVKFLFATTEVEKLPVTVLSRTQRFDLRRIPAELLEQHFASICRQESVEAEPEALHLIAAAAEGSVRDGLSILDQAIAHADLDTEGKVTAGRVRDMLGLADRGAQRRLFACLLEGDPQGLLAALADQYALGVEPLALMRALMDLTNKITVTQVGGSGADAPTAEERAVIEDWAARLSPGQLHRLWQLLLRGYDEVKGAPDPLVAAQMALLRTLHASDMPDPGTLAKKLEEVAARAASAAPAASSSDGSSAPVATAPKVDWAELVSRIEREGGSLHLASRLRMQVRPVEIGTDRLVFAQAPGFSEDLGPELRQALLELTGNRWQVEQVAEGGEPTLVERDQAERADADAKMRAHPLVEATFNAFPDAEFIADDDVNSPPWRHRA
ncbi:DNA polymerase III subunit tau [Tsuneonella dongtanensis]|uniref:DNA polymerase III subunit gamma/tau n=1 Tax=Tsuneonella dongtanensis TaxID=692370 RepID=A0A1B2AG93_9SPHN|nr:DNA polymerase III subunit gamma/tau [Tsuneonella dongtanensis]ANY21162.1 DNA polymerase III subunit tau [Tsuneonella dongtanensis]